MMTVSAIKALVDEGDARADTSKVPRLSTDFLNRYSEALMLIELAADDDGVVDDLRAWRSVTYREHFEGSPLRCTPSALAAYDRLAPACRAGFEDLCRAMSRLVETATALLAERRVGLEPATIVEVASDALRRQISRAAQFINANGTVEIGNVESRVLQAEIDALLAR
ncbi:hypothetical protein [Bosea sp. 124]|uniref:hypothetical protein n=1 Tax=Bosea sp. 124 TaxID=2135642 RepID=UPI000D3CF22E|nr:hypothetical protein [Bosea sp. 124]PTM38874.1 hypothetical protein C8D03_0349 [Bosea sp. 124]